MPLHPDVRVDTLIGEMRDAEPARTLRHRGQQALTLTDAELRGIVDSLVESGVLLRSGHRIRLAEGGPALDKIMRERVELLLGTLTAAGAKPPPAEAVAAGLGIPDQLVEQLRAAGDLVSIGPRIDVTSESWATIAGRLDRLAEGGDLTVGAVRDELGTTRRIAEAILQRWNPLRSHE
jgi:hypothetical protein